MARKPADRQIGRHILKGLRFDINGNPLYTCDTFSNEIAKVIGWRFSPKYGLYGQFPIVSDPTIFNESKNTIRLTESELKNIITESVKNILKEGGAFDVIRNVKSKDERRRVRDLTKRVLKPEDIQDAFKVIERVLDEISYLENPRISIHYIGDLYKKVESLKQEFSMVTSNLTGTVANHFANPWSQDRTTYKYRPTNEIPVDDTEQDS